MKNWLFPFVQTLFTALVVLSFYAVSWWGEEFTLRAEPYDPFDPFLGEYVLLQYPDLEPPAEFNNQTVYFTLEEGADGYAVIEKIDDQPFFGSIEGHTYQEFVTAPQLEQFYVEQGKGPALEAAEDLEVTVHVAPWGAVRPVNLEERSIE